MTLLPARRCSLVDCNGSRRRSFSIDEGMTAAIRQVVCLRKETYQFPRQ